MTFLGGDGHGLVGPNGTCFSPGCGDDGSQILMLNDQPFASTGHLARTDGSAFSLTSFMGAEGWGSHPDYWALGIHLQAGPIGQDFLFDYANDGAGGMADFQAFAPILFTDVLSVDFSAIPDLSLNHLGNIFLLDNIIGGEPVAGSPDPVPEPSTLVLLGTGIIGVMRRARQDVSRLLLLENGKERDPERQTCASASARSSRSATPSDAAQ